MSRSMTVVPTVIVAWWEPKRGFQTWVYRRGPPGQDKQTIRVYFKDECDGRLGAARAMFHPDNSDKLPYFSDADEARLHMTNDEGYLGMCQLNTGLAYVFFPHGVLAERVAG
jgi:hypothetical protein